MNASGLARHLLLPGLVAAAFSLVSCVSVTGPKYSEVKSTLTPQNGKGLVMIYWLDGRELTPWPLSANNQVLTDKFKPHRFYSYQAPAGPLVLALLDSSKPIPGAGQGAVDGATRGLIAAGPAGALLGAAAGAIAGSAGAKEEARIRDSYKPFDVKAGNIYYMEFKMNQHFTRASPVFEHRTKQAAEEGLEQCQWINTTSR
jgi:hypothetical protein